MSQPVINKLPAGDTVIESKRAYGILAGALIAIMSLGLGIGYVFFWDKPEYSSPEDYQFKTSYNNVKRSPKDADLRIELGWVYLQQSNYKKALEEYKNALKINPKHAGAKLNIAMVYATQKNYQKAKVELEDLVKKFPSFVDARVALGSVFYNLKEYSKALEQYDFALKANPGTVDYLYMIGQIYQVQGKHEEAKQQYQQALKYVPDFKPALEALKTLTATAPSADAKSKAAAGK